MGHPPGALTPLVVEHAGYLWLIPLFPLVGAALNATLGWRLERGGRKPLVHGIGVGAVALSLAVAVYAFGHLAGLPPERRFLQDTLWNVLTAGRLSVDLAFALDPLSMMMVLVITFVGALIHVFSIGYMWNDEAHAYWRFFAWMNLFVFSMLLLVMADNLALMFFGWEGVGLCSYGLIAFYYTDREKAAAGMKAFVVNRVGDFGFLAGLLLLFWALGGTWTQVGRAPNPHYQPAAEIDVAAPSAAPSAAAPSVRIGPTLNFRELRDQVAIEATGVARRLRDARLFGVGLLGLVAVLLFVGAMGKSAQLPLHVWLPDAMAGPTPVSALIHAATMVTAGVYLVARLDFLFALSPSAMGWIASVGALTALFAASIGLLQHDLKKVLAYSTVSQLGFMFIGVGVGAYWAGAYHLLTHAFFKATLFLAAGSVILGCHHEQDMRRMGGLARHMPVTRWTYLAACWAIAGFPWASGFYSKDEILWRAFTSEHLALFGIPTPWLGQVLYLAGLVAATGTSFYMFRSYYLTFTGPYRGAAPPDAREGHDPDHGQPDHGEEHDVDLDDRGEPEHGAPLHGLPGDGHHALPHESPITITAVLVLLAAGAVLAGLLGLPRAWTGHEPLLEAWLAPALTARVPFVEGPGELELLLELAGVGAGVAGWLLARTLYRDAQSAAPARLQASFRGLWTLIYRKYYVDELYDRVVVRPALALARLFAWLDGHVIDLLVNLVGLVARGLAAVDDLIDRAFVDGAVHAVAAAIVAGGRTLRRVQTGRIQTYLYGGLAGGLAVVLFLFLLH